MVIFHSLKRASLWVAAAAVMAIPVVATSCADSPEPPISSEKEGLVNLRLKVNINNPAPAASASRAFDNYQVPIDYEDAATVYEGINTLRIILVDPNGVVEGNKTLTFSDKIPDGTPYGEFRFTVKGGENKRVYAIANEASIVTNDPAAPAPDFTAYLPGTTLTPAMAEAMIISTPTNLFIDNTGTDKKYLPLSEFFDVYINEAVAGSDNIQEETLFVNRAAVKWAFATEWVGNEASQLYGLHLTEITVTGLASAQYLFPNSTTYDPGKYTDALTVNASTKKVVTAYKCPPLSQYNDTTSYTFTPDNFGLNYGGTGLATTYAPELYFHESPIPNDGIYRISAKGYLTGDDESTATPLEFGPVALPNLPSLPRNTFVVVNFQFTPYTLNLEVTLVPYIGVWLDPIFGLDTTKPDPDKEETE